MKFIYFIALFVIINNLVNKDIILQNHFSTFKDNYNKKYTNIEEEAKRFDIFKKNYEKYGYINEFSDVADYEQAKEEFKTTKKLPDSINYSNILGDAKNQQNCGFCYAFSFFAQIEAQFSIKYGKSYRFSEQELLDCSNDIINCNGGNPDKIKNFLFFRNYIALENQYPGFSGISDPSQCKTISQDIDKFKSTIKFKVDKVDFLNVFKKKEQCIKYLLVKHGPLGAGIRADAFNDYIKGQIIDHNPFECLINKTTNHAITIVGYDTYYDLKTKKDVSYWIIRNSYGIDFGEKGYAKIKSGDNICGIEDKIHYITISWDSWCGKGCNKCKYNSINNKLVCESCISGYRYDENIKMCHKCKEGCASCTNSFDCKICNNGYMLINNDCLKCAKDCKKCTGIFKDQCIEWFIEEDNVKENITDYEFCCSKFLVIYILFIIELFLF